MAINLNAKGKKLEPLKFSWKPKDILLYNIGIGATELPFVYETQLKVIPTFAVVPTLPLLAASLSVVKASPMKVLHGEQTIVLKTPKLPLEAETVSEATVTDIFDKGKGALYRLHTTTKTAAGEELFDNIFSIFVRGEGGFGGEKGPEAGNNPPARDPDAVVEEATLPVQNLIYRLSGDINPLHIDPNFAKIAGFPRPILHGLCTFGFVARAVLKTFCNNDPAKLKSYEVRFRDVVYPGDTLTTSMWKEGEGRVILQAKTQDGRTVIANAAAMFSA
ncbi:MAG: hypothetical protein A2V67_18825 [Deltaproteobacteria bacterium RBG_13_61_14]|nr:MAG: hypothetical protein A2V67_18825 [Deltaproteobacteria bacterium RBG_13_61_14]